MVTLNWKCFQKRRVWKFPFTLHEKEITDLEITKIMATFLFWILWTICLSSLRVFVYVCWWVDLCMCVPGESIKSNWLQNVPGALNNLISHTLNYIFTPQAPRSLTWTQWNKPVPPSGFHTRWWWFMIFSIYSKQKLQKWVLHLFTEVTKVLSCLKSVAVGIWVVFLTAVFLKE